MIDRTYLVVLHVIDSETILGYEVRVAAAEKQATYTNVRSTSSDDGRSLGPKNR